MSPWKARVPLLAAALWWGSLTAIGFMAVPLLFSQLPASTAGQAAARLFTGQACISIACGLLVLIAARGSDDEPTMDWGRGALVFVVTGLLLAVLGEFAVSPRIRMRQDLAFWHTAGTVLYAGQWLCALAVFWRLSAPTSSPSAASASPS